MTKLAKAVTGFIEQMGWEDEVDDNDEAGTSRLEARAMVMNQLCRIFVDGDDNAHTIAVFFYLPFRARKDKITETCVLLNGINVHTRYGHLEVDLEDGEIRMAHKVDFEHAEATGEAVRKMADSIAATLESWMPEIVEVAMTGRSARQVLAEEAEREAAREAAKTAGEDAVADDNNVPMPVPTRRGPATLH